MKPISVKTLESYLPHRHPMVWIDSVVEVGSDYRSLTGLCLVDVKPEALYVNNQRELRASAAIEFTAQAFGYIKAAYQELNNFRDAPRETYLTGVRHCYANFTGLELKGLKLKVKIAAVREVRGLTFIKGEVLTESDEVLARVEIQVYFG